MHTSTARAGSALPNRGSPSGAFDGYAVRQTAKGCGVFIWLVVVGWIATVL